VPEHAVVSRLSNQNDLALRRVSSACLSDSSIIIQMRSAAVCGTDIGMLSGNRHCEATVLGHEGVGVVVYAPEGCGVATGTRVVINPVNQKHPEKVIGHSWDGAFRDFFSMEAGEAAEGKLLVACPADCAVEDAELALTEPLASVFYSQELLSERHPNATLIARGSGNVGILSAKLWSKTTGNPAIVVSQSEAHAQWLRGATSWPANVRICSSAELKNVIRDFSEPKAAVLCCSRESAPEGFRTLLDAVAEGGTIDLMAGFPDSYREDRIGGIALDRIRWDNSCGVNNAPPTSVRDRTTGKTLNLIGHRGTSERHIIQAIDLLSRGVITLADVPHRLLTLEQLPATVSQMLSKNRNQTKFVKAIVTFSRENRGETVGAR
jgi:threonine dehydrogenase-like Zn-dependent dehydrogenase